MKVSAIVPTIGRPASLSRLLETLAAQTLPLAEILVADASTSKEAAQIASDRSWQARGLAVRRIRVSSPNAVRQRVAAIKASRGEYLLLLDDDVELEPNCVEEMLRGMASAPDVVAVVGDFSRRR